MRSSGQPKLGDLMIASASGACITSLTMTPLDVVRIRLQAQTKPLTKGTLFNFNTGLMDHFCVACNNHLDNPPWYKKTCPLKFNGTLDAFRKIVRHEGISALWSGLTPTLVISLPSTMIYYTSYDKLKYHFGLVDGDPSTTHRAVLASATARALTVMLVNPFEIIRTKKMSMVIPYRDLFKTVTYAIKTEGLLKTLYRGVLASLLRDVIFSGIYWFSYESFKARHLSSKQHSHHITPTYSILFGSMAGSIAAILTHPLDTLKTRVQIEVIAHDPSVNIRMRSIFKDIFARLGVRGIYTGLGMRLLKIAPACAIMITSFEMGKKFFQDK